MHDEVIAPNPSPDSESLVKRLAGPSTTKAGLAKDQSEINRIIAEVSRGSKFYENEKRKDKDLTERIARMLKQRDEVLKGVDLPSVEQGVDQLLARMEQHRDLSQTIVHVDMDAFYASVELLDNASLKGKAFAVGKGVLTTASYEARKFGVRSGMASFVARKLCPDLILVENRFGRYTEMSKQVMDVFRRYDPNMCAAGCDEGYLNITAYCEDHQLTVEECVRQMREAVKQETDLTVSAGIAPNKMLAKICSDKNKPNGQFKLDFNPEAIKAFMHDLSIRKVPGVGRVNERLLDSIGIKTCGDIFTHRAIVAMMDKQFGLHFLLQAYLGIASNDVQPGQREERKSIGAERTFTPLKEQSKILQKLEEVAAELESDMNDGGWTGKTVTLKYKLDTYQVFTRARSFDRCISTNKEDLFAIGKDLLIPELPLTLRLIGLRVTKLKDLRAEVENNSGGIKRFFESANSAESSRNLKKARVEAEQWEEEPHLTQDGYQDAMPGYHEHGDLDDDLNVDHSFDDHIDGNSSDVQQPYIPRGSPQRPPRSPKSAPSSSIRARTYKPTSSGSQKPRSAYAPPTSALESNEPPSDSTSHLPVEEVKEQDGVTSMLTCPVCGKSMRTDNIGLNSHIDFCLSEDAIKEAQVSASVPVPSKGFRPHERRNGSDNNIGRRKRS
ncbi:DNA/RNA polymerase [Laetiporus sulphureus 93-53]|uniref:DNA polymerase kappa n=1 Tax=Laetiporus sulphureus 93-53 TaxID=1314785 RepID=A0A165GRS1_9APHY|nr:DNA/RNA polymerase [Laetiporus sulphureus 93-53]KZT10718.1 DNA/RNA polymerase [Laetiporus sulphureus 93-53]